MTAFITTTTTNLKTMVSIDKAVLALKRKALECKKAGDIEAAKQHLLTIKSLQALAQDTTDPTRLEQLASLLQQAGDEQGAKEALKQQQQQQQENVEYESPVNKACDDANLEELQTGVAFTTEEMLDVEILVDMKASGMEIPSKQEYLDKCMTCKRQAVQAKQQGDIAAAKKYLLQFKQLEQAMERLYSNAENTVNMEQEDDGEDYTLLEELYNANARQGSVDDGFFEELFGKESTAIELDDLDDLDPSMLRDMIASGMQVPDVDEVLKSAAEKKTAAIEFKKAGNLIAAKAALEESKRLTARATQLSNMLQAMEALGDKDNELDVDPTLDPEAALEAMLKATEGKEAPKVAAQAPAKQQQPQQPLKSSQEYKIQAVTCKKEGKTQEALVALKLYKQALAVEANAKAEQKRKESLNLLQMELETCTKQSLLFCYYQRFVDETVGKSQSVAWKLYSQNCAAMIDKLTTGGEPTEQQRIKSSSMRLIQNEGGGLGFIGQSMNPSEQRIEISILEVLNVDTNKNLRKALNVTKTAQDVDGTIRVLVTVQLPPSSEAPAEDNTELEFKSESREDGTFVFGPCQYVNTERGSSRFAKMIARRLKRKKMTIEVFYLPPKKGIFSRSTKEVLLGTVTIKLEDLLETNVIAGEFPISDKSGRHKLGGLARVAVRTGAAFTESNGTKKEEKEDQVADVKPGLTMQHYEAFSLSN